MKSLSILAFNQKKWYTKTSAGKPGVIYQLDPHHGFYLCYFGIHNRISTCGASGHFCLRDAPVIQDKLALGAIGRDVRLQYIQQCLFGVTIAESGVGGDIFGAQGGDLVGLGEGAVQREHVARFGILGLVDTFGIRLDRHYLFLERCGILENTNEVVLGFAHFLTIQTRQNRHGFFDVGFWFLKDWLASDLVESTSNVARHLQMLDLVAPHGHHVYVVADNVRHHQDGVVEDAHVDVRVLRFRVLKTVRPQHQRVWRHVIQDPVELRKVCDVGLPKDRNLGVQPEHGQITRHQVAEVAFHHLGREHAGERVQVRDKEQGVGVRLGRELLERENGAEQVAQVGHIARGLDGGEDAEHRMENINLFDSAAHEIYPIFDRKRRRKLRARLL